jgi:thiamine pyrophosphokinase
VPALDQLAAELRPPATDALVICADGGYRKAALLGLTPALVVGDGDSLTAELLAELAARGVPVQVHPVDKDESDTELALREAIGRGARRIVVLGALGGVRFDHALANVLLLAMPELRGVDVALVDGTTTVRLLAADASGGEGAAMPLARAPGDLVSLLPLTARVDGVITDGLRYALRDETLHQGAARGLSNELTADAARVRIGDGRLAVIQTRGGARS